MRTLGLLAGAAMLLGACGGGQDQGLTISEVSVDTNLSALQTREAVAYWQNLSADLETAIAAEFAGRFDPLGSRITVDVDELSLSNAFAAPVSPEDARLAGRVTLENPDGTTAAAYDVVATLDQARAYLPAGADTVVITPGSAEFYQAVVRAFARGAAEAIAGGQA